MDDGWMDGWSKSECRRASLTQHLPSRTQLANTEEFKDGKPNGKLGEVFVRCNNVLYLREVNDDDAEADADEAK